MCELGTWLYVYRTHRHMLHFRHASKYVCKGKTQKSTAASEKANVFPTSDIKLFGDKNTKLMRKNALYNKQQCHNISGGGYHLLELCSVL